MFTKFTTFSLMLTWLIFENVCNSLGNHAGFCKLLKIYNVFAGTCFATFQEKPCARMQNMYPSNDRRGSLSSRLFKRILQREWKNVSEQWSSRTPVIATFEENPAARIKIAKMQKLTSWLLQRILRRDPQQQKAQFAAWWFSLYLKATFCKMCENP